ncbi:MAG TPA: hypothetical protein VHG35_18900 [Gemmatimonadales bacterium]|nr:hypothetical protein [Gemmatimonadales bacterium]
MTSSTSDEVLARLVSGLDKAATRQRYGLAAVAVTRVLNHAADAATCTRLTQFVETELTTSDWRARWSPTYYKVSNLYYVVLVPKPADPTPLAPGEVYIDLRWSGVYVPDGQYKVLARIAS